MTSNPSTSSSALVPEDSPPHPIYQENQVDPAANPEEIPESDPEEDPEEEEEVAPVPHTGRYGAARLPVPAPADVLSGELLEYLDYNPEEETIVQFCNYVNDLCIVWSQSEYGFDLFRHPLFICRFILEGLPREELWSAIKVQYEDIVIMNQWGRPVPNESKYKHEADEVYAIDTAILTERLNNIMVNVEPEEEVEEQDEDIDIDDIDDVDAGLDEEVNGEYDEMDVEEELFEQDEDEDEFEVEDDAEVIRFDPSDIEHLFTSDDEK